MKLEITAAEAMEAMQRLEIDVSYNRLTSSWCASCPVGHWRLGWGATPLEAITHLLERVGETATVQVEVASAS